MSDSRSKQLVYVHLTQRRVQQLVGGNSMLVLEAALVSSWPATLTFACHHGGGSQPDEGLRLPPNSNNRS